MSVRSELSWLTYPQLVALTKQKTDMEYRVICQASRKVLINILQAVPDVLVPEEA